MLEKEQCPNCGSLLEEIVDGEEDIDLDHRYTIIVASHNECPKCGLVRWGDDIFRPYAALTPGKEEQPSG